MAFTLLGIILVGLSLWKTVDFSWTDNGITAKFEVLEDKVEIVNSEVQELDTKIADLQETNLSLIRAVALQSKYAVDERWSEIYSKADSLYRTKKGIGHEQELSREQAEDIAGLATLIREEIFKDIEKQEDELISALRNGESIRQKLRELSSEAIVTAISR